MTTQSTTTEELEDLPSRGRHDKLLFEGVRLYVPDADQRKNWKDPSKCMVFWENVYEPLTYRIEGGIYGSKEVQRLMLASNLTEAEAEEVRKTQSKASIPEEKMVSRSTSDDRPARSELDLFMRSVKKAGFGVGFRKSDGTPVCTAVGHIVETEDKEREELSYKNRKTGEWTRPPYVRAIIGVDDDFLAPDPGERRVVDRTPKAKEGEQAGPAPANTGPTAAALRAGADSAGMLGMSITDLEDSDSQVRFANIARSKSAPVFAHPEVQKAAEKGELLSYLTEKGAISISAGGTITLGGE